MESISDSCSYDICCCDCVLVSGLSASCISSRYVLSPVLRDSYLNWRLLYLSAWSPDYRELLFHGWSGSDARLDFF